MEMAISSLPRLPLPQEGPAAAVGLSSTSKPVQLAKQVPVASGKAEQAAAQFESFFLYLLLRELDKTVPRSGFLGSTLADDFFRDMYYERLADALCEGASPLGLSELIGSQLDSAAKEGEAVVAPDPAGLRLGLFTKAGYPLPQLLHD